MDKKYKVAIIEDDKDIQQLIVKELNKQEYEVVFESDGLKALNLLQEDAELDLVIIDLMLPNRDGISIIQEVRKESTVPILIISAKDTEFDKIVGLENGADDYLVKPFSVYELLARVKSILRRYSEYNIPEKKLIDNKIFDFTLLPEEYAILKSGERIQLTNKEYKLLQFFIKNPKKIFTKFQIYKEVWDDEFLNDDNVLNVTMRRLRKKIEDDPSNPKYIITIWGIGYKLGDDA
ncbi:response regulator transcription factor [Lactobacillus sp. YT155]|uniref:response regulator transcription factor n=1 Tax=Lactobacillus sp. YT155 TaxID=3060955 RepID=UPI00265D7357|nr:response regulator transcription factor [Lactobacillus sp. YT155]MDO1604519.1 response regulator transcription factor [Lactobacillus sp. YT155]